MPRKNARPMARKKAAKREALAAGGVVTFPKPAAVGKSELSMVAAAAVLGASVLRGLSRG